VKDALPEVDCGPPEQAVKYSNWRKGYRQRMEKKGIEKTKATEIMWSWQEEQHAKTHLKRHRHVIKHTPSCVDHYPPEKAMQHRAWRRKTASQHKVDAPLPRPKSASAVRWRSTFKQMNLSMAGLNAKDLDAPLLDLSLPDCFAQVAEEQADSQLEGSMEDSELYETEPDVSGCQASESQVGHTAARSLDRRTSVEILEDDERNPSEQCQGRPLTVQVETSVSSRPSSRQSERGARSSQSVARSSTQKRPSSQRSSRDSARQLARSKSQSAPRGQSANSRLENQVTYKDVAVHKGRPTDFSRGLMGAYMGAASNDHVRQLLAKTSQAWTGVSA